MKELNVIGTMQLLAACQQAPDLRKLVLKSSAAVYGASNRDPAMFTEGMNAKRLPTAASPRTSPRSSPTCAGSPAAGPTSRSPRCGSPTSSVRGSSRR